MNNKAEEPTIGYALRGLLVWALAAVGTFSLLVLLAYVLRFVGVDLETSINPRTDPLAAVVMCVTVLSVGILLFYVAVMLSLLALSPFVGRPELKSHFVEQLGPGKVLAPFHRWLFGRIFGEG